VAPVEIIAWAPEAALVGLQVADRVRPERLAAGAAEVEAEGGRIQAMEEMAALGLTGIVRTALAGAEARGR